MSPQSLRLRLLVAAALSVTIILGIAGTGLSFLFERYVERRVGAELDRHLIQLAAGIEVDSKGEIKVTRDLADPRFSEPLSGLYWQIDANGNGVARSRSLWDEHLVVPTPPSGTGETHVHALVGPGNVGLFSKERLVILPVNGKDVPLVLTVGIDHREIADAVSAFKQDLFAALLVLGAALTAAAWLQVAVGLKPLEVIRSRLEGVRSGAATRLEGDFPLEVQPLVEEVNELLSAQEGELVRARRRAGDLAHGLKTPVSILGSIARDLRRSGAAKAAGEVEEQAETLALHVDRELARARLATGHGKSRTVLKPALERMIAAMKRLPDGSHLAWDCGCPEGDAVPLEVGDLTELLGNVLDNARKWAKSRVAVSAARQADRLILTVEDDGPGVPEEKLAQIAEPGRRLDENTQGSGLGLAIVSDMAAAYGLDLNYARSPLGGLKVAVEFPGAAAGHPLRTALVAFAKTADYNPARS